MEQGEADDDGGASSCLKCPLRVLSGSNLPLRTSLMTAIICRRGAARLSLEYPIHRSVPGFDMVPEDSACVPLRTVLRHPAEHRGFEAVGAYPIDVHGTEAKGQEQST